MVARFFARERIDAWLTPTLSAPPVPLGEIVSTPDGPLRAAERSRGFVGFPAVVANITGAPAMSVPLWWNAGRAADRASHFLGRFGDEATLLRPGLPARAGAPLGREVASPGTGVVRAARAKAVAMDWNRSGSLGSDMAAP